MGHKDHAVGAPNNRGRTDVIPPFKYNGTSYPGWGDPAQLKGTHPLCGGQHVPPKLIVIKVVEGSGAPESTFRIIVTATSPSPASFDGEGAPGTEVTLVAGNYSVTEVDSGLGFSETYSSGCSGSIANGETKICTVTNTANEG